MPGVFSTLSLILGRRYLRRHPIATDTPTLNKRGHQYIGRIFTLDQPIVNGTESYGWMTPSGRSPDPTVSKGPECR